MLRMLLLLVIATAPASAFALRWPLSPLCPHSLTVQPLSTIAMNAADELPTTGDAAAEVQGADADIPAAPPKKTGSGYKPPTEPFLGVFDINDPMGAFGASITVSVGFAAFVEFIKFIDPVDRLN